MEVFEIEGGKRLKGRIAVSGLKNAATPIIAATLLTKEPCVLKNIPRIEDVFRMLEILERICIGEGRPEDLGRLEELALQVKKNSLCGLGQTAPNPVLSTIRYFRNEYEERIVREKGPSAPGRE